MATNTETLRRKIQSAEDLLSVVKTMKGLAAVNIRHYEHAVESLSEYSRTVDMGLHIALSANPDKGVSFSRPRYDRTGVILFGSDQGLCGQFNERIVDFVIDTLDGLPESTSEFSTLVVGARSVGLWEEAGRTTDALLSTPGGITGISPLVQDLLFYVERWQIEEEIERILIYHNHPTGSATYEQVSIQLLPVNLDWLRELEHTRWPSRSLPTYTMDWDSLFAALIRQRMFVVLFRACAESLAAENAARVASMQNAESNIEDRIEELNRSYHRQRQNQITAELLDIVSGYDAVMGERQY